MHALKKNDLVTVALRSRENGLLSRTEVTDVAPSVFMPTGHGRDCFMANDDDRSIHYFANEGITWVRGHVDDDSPEGKALIAANALAPLEALAFHTTATGFTWSGSLSIGNNPNPKNELGE